jgi:hypothetical protein
LFRRGVEVMRKTPPTPRAPEMKLRVWQSLQYLPAAAPPGLRFLVLKLAFAAIVALGAGTAGAMIARRWIAPERAPAAATATAILPRSRPEAAAPVPPVTTIVGPVQERRSPGAPAPAPARAAPKKTAAGAPPSAASVARERTEVLDALVALRREHDAVRAGTLLSRYLATHPRGALREEALVLAIEAADARSDRDAAARLARTYQADYPAGRFLNFVRSHTAPTAADGRASQ